MGPWETVTFQSMVNPATIASTVALIGGAIYMMIYNLKSKDFLFGATIFTISLIVLIVTPGQHQQKASEVNQTLLKTVLEDKYQVGNVNFGNSIPFPFLPTTQNIVIPAISVTKTLSEPTEPAASPVPPPQETLICTVTVTPQPDDTTMVCTEPLTTL